MFKNCIRKLNWYSFVHNGMICKRIMLYILNHTIKAEQNLQQNIVNIIFSIITETYIIVLHQLISKRTNCHNFIYRQVKIYRGYYRRKERSDVKEKM